MLESRKRKSQPAMRGLQPFLRRLDDAAENLNPVLIVIIIGLALLDFSVFAAFELRNLPLRHVSPISAADQVRPLTFGQAVGLPQR